MNPARVRKITAAKTVSRTQDQLAESGQNRGPSKVIALPDPDVID